MERLIPHVQHSAWGSVDALPQLLGVDPDGRPWAELWIGDHPRLPSTVASTGEPLAADLPFLLKILAADSPLSIQSHPSLGQAKAGFERENAAGIAIDARNRTYRDPNHKPELICALTPFEALCGFRDPAELADEFGLFPDLADMAEQLRRPEGLRSAVGWLLSLSPERASDIIAAAIPHFELAARLNELHPGDIGAIVALLLNHLVLEPGEAVFLEAGNVHAYLGGMAVEIMANSDNVIRGGLTPKFIDRAELMAVVDFTPLVPSVQVAVDRVHRFDVPIADFALERLDIDGPVTIEVHGPELVLITAGRAELSSTMAEPFTLGPGGATYLDPADRTVTLAPAGDEACVAWRATVGQ